MNLLTRLSHATLGADMKTFKMLYQPLIKSRLEYGNEINKSTKFNSSKSLIPVFYNVLGVTSGAVENSPVNSLEKNNKGNLTLEYS